MSLPITFGWDEDQGKVVNTCPHACGEYGCQLSGNGPCYMMRNLNPSMHGSSSVPHTSCDAFLDHQEFIPQNLQGVEVYIVEDSAEEIDKIRATVCQILGNEIHIASATREGQVQADINAGQVGAGMIVILDGRLYTKRTDESIAASLVKTGAKVISNTGEPLYSVGHRNAGIEFYASKSRLILENLLLGFKKSI